MKKLLYAIFGLASVGLLSSAAGSSPFFELSKQFDVFSSLFKEVANVHVDEPEPSKMMKTFIDGMLRQLDPYTQFYSGSEVERSRISEAEKITGIGIQYAMYDSIPVITEIKSGLSAEKAGIQVGDKILAVNGKSVIGKSGEEIGVALKGESGSEVQLKILTIGGEEKTLSVMRMEFHETNVPYFGMLNKHTGFISLKIFNPDAAKDVREAFEKLRSDNPEMKSLVLDLRDNPGGLLHEAVKIVNIFVPKNQLVATMRGRTSNATYKTLDEPLDVKIPIVVLTNNRSASSSEIVSGALQDYDRAVIMGQKTYGKGLVQQVKNLSYGTAFKVTVAKYYIPSGRCVQSINYAERNEDGSVKRVPDSLKTVFKTTNGRKVYDGGGIDPDVVLAKGVTNSFLQDLQKQYLIFDFATAYRKEHKTIDSPAVFAVKNADFERFVAFAKKRNFSSKSETDILFEKLKKVTVDEKYYDAVQTDYEKALSKLSEAKDEDYVRHKEEIVALLENEICNRYYSVSGKIEKSLQTDPAVKSAIKLLNSPKEYTELLAAKK